VPKRELALVEGSFLLRRRCGRSRSSLGDFGTRNSGSDGRGGLPRSPCPSGPSPSPSSSSCLRRRSRACRRGLSSPAPRTGGVTGAIAGFSRRRPAAGSTRGAAGNGRGNLGARNIGSNGPVRLPAISPPSAPFSFFFLASEGELALVEGDFLLRRPLRAQPERLGDFGTRTPAATAVRLPRSPCPSGPSLLLLLLASEGESRACRRGLSSPASRRSRPRWTEARQRSSGEGAGGAEATGCPATGLDRAPIPAGTVGGPGGGAIDGLLQALRAEPQAGAEAAP